MCPLPFEIRHEHRHPDSLLASEYPTAVPLYYREVRAAIGAENMRRSTGRNQGHHSCFRSSSVRAFAPSMAWAWGSLIRPRPAAVRTIS